MTDKDPFRIEDRRSVLCGIAGETVCLTYRKAVGEKIERVVTITDLFEAYGNMFIDGFCHLRGEDRTFRLDRIHRIRELTASGCYDSCLEWLDSYGVRAETYFRGPGVAYRLLDRGGTQ